MRIALALQYDGSAFCGWQSQPDNPTLQDAVEAALRPLAKDATLRVHAAGRTDAGVHATAQVAHFDAAVERAPDEWTRALNWHLPPSIRIVWAAAVADAFHARFCALQRHYTYYVYNGETLPPFLHRKAAHCRTPLQVVEMQAAAQTLIGTHDFSAFRAAACQAASPIRTLSALHITQHGALIAFHFVADGFLHHMVRNIIGALLLIGQVQQPPGWMADLLASGDRKLGAATARPDGLYFTGVDYPPTFALPPTTATPTLLSS